MISPSLCQGGSHGRTDTTTSRAGRWGGGSGRRGSSGGSARTDAHAAAHHPRSSPSWESVLRTWRSFSSPDPRGGQSLAVASLTGSHPAQAAVMGYVGKRPHGHDCSGEDTHCGHQGGHQTDSLHSAFPSSCRWDRRQIGRRTDQVELDVQLPPGEPGYERPRPSVMVGPGAWTHTST